MACCKNKKYYTELCDKCKEEITTFNTSEYGDQFDRFKDIFKEDDGLDWFGSTFSTKCECGSEKVGSSKHSSWCPKFETPGV